MEKFIVKIRPVIVNGVAIAPGAACESEAEFSSAISAEMFLDDFDRNWKDNSVGDSSPTVGLRDGCLISAIIEPEGTEKIETEMILTESIITWDNCPTQTWD